MRRLQTTDGEHGAILIHMALAMLALLSFLTIVVDYGVFWTSRGQSQNSADAGALAGALALAYDQSSTTIARESAVVAATSNIVFGAVPSVIPGTDVTFPTCPDGTAGCVRVDVYRTGDRGNPLPVFAGTMVGVASQNVRASAIAQVAGASASDCLKPWTLLDAWQDSAAGGWTPTSKFGTGDVYTPPSASGPGTGFYPYESNGSPSRWLGMSLAIRVDQRIEYIDASGQPAPYTAGQGNGNSNAWHGPLALSGQGARDYRDAITECVPLTFSVGETIDTKPGNFADNDNQTGSLVREVIARDPSAVWDAGSRSVVNSNSAVSPRIVAVPLVNPDPAQWAGTSSSRRPVPVVGIVGFFLESANGGIINGRLVPIPGLIGTGGSLPSSATFARTVMLVR